MGVLERMAALYRQNPDPDGVPSSQVRPDASRPLVGEAPAESSADSAGTPGEGQATATPAEATAPYLGSVDDDVPQPTRREQCPHIRNGKQCEWAAGHPPAPGAAHSFAPESLRRYLEPTETEMRADAVTWAGAPSAVETADTRRPLPEWSPEYKLRHALARPALAHQLVEALPTHLAVELAEVVEGLFERRMRVVEAAVVAQTKEVLARMREDAEAKLQEVHDERYRGNSRLS